jgi:DNA-binding transcriptional LysR family regulator
MLDLRRLRLLRELDARGTVGAAAAALGYTPSAVSQQLAVLEREAGVALLQRAGRNVRLTDAGRVLVVHAAALQDGVEAAEAALAASAATIAGSVRIAAFQTAMLHIVTPAIAALAISHPAVRVEVVEAEVEEALGALTQQRVDVLIGDEYGGLPRPRARGLRRETLLREQIRLVLPAAHPLARRRRVPLAGAARCGVGRRPRRHEPPRDGRPRLSQPRRLRARPAPCLQRPDGPAGTRSPCRRRRAAPGSRRRGRRRVGRRPRHRGRDAAARGLRADPHRRRSTPGTRRGSQRFAGGRGGRPLVLRRSSSWARRAA